MAGLKETLRIEESLELQELDKDIFKSIKLWKPSSGVGAFGGNIIAQAAHAAAKTVQVGYHLHSFHSYFIGIGDVDIPTGIIYLVDRIREGKSYATRSVKAIQRSRCIFTLLISFHKPEINQAVLQHKIDLSKIPPPEDCQSVETRLQTYIDDNLESIKPKMLEYLERQIEEHKLNAIQYRHTKSRRFDQSFSDDITSETYWLRSRAKIRSDPAFQKLVLAYASDGQLGSAISNALGLNLAGGPRTSIEFEVSEWMLYKVDAEVGKEGRGLLIGRIYSHDGRLIAVCTQEAVVRVETTPKVVPKL
ncbi:hypothetical protein PSTT_06329 [Puccinia striiformis]|uniref:Acyl-CoA thioesterase II n=1 Tax=Puccinia striiformis TaxID=27350 RepID=A0A2S4VKM2_9BASI|nr:hypothetical protein PSTT_06329 [Puccinia striiformis]